MTKNNLSPSFSYHKVTPTGRSSFGMWRRCATLKTSPTLTSFLTSRRSRSFWRRSRTSSASRWTCVSCSSAPTRAPKFWTSGRRRRWRQTRHHQMWRMKPKTSPNLPFKVWSDTTTTNSKWFTPSWWITILAIKPFSLPSTFACLIINVKFYCKLKFRRNINFENSSPTFSLQWVI